MSDDLEVKELVSHLYVAADQMRPEALQIDGSNPAEVGKALDYLIQHARATEGALRKIGQLMDEMRAGASGSKTDKSKK